MYSPLMMEYGGVSQADFYRNELDLSYNQSRLMKLFMALRLDYHVIPASIRNAAGRMLHSRGKLLRDFPIDRRVDSINPQTGLWDEDFACCFTHDLDNAYSVGEGLERLLEIEGKNDIFSTLNVVPESGGYNIESDRFKELQGEGFEFGAHGLRHDGRFAFISPKEREERVGLARERLVKAGLDVKGFRVPWLNRTRDLVGLLDKYGYMWDSSCPDTDPSTIGYEGTGCSTVYPFRPLIAYDGEYLPSRVVELPVTVPQDWTLIHSLGLSRAEVLDMWKKKVDYIESVGGLALFLTHPAEYGICGDRYVQIYDDIIEYVRGKEPFIGTCREICRQYLKNTGDEDSVCR
jgi:peptidoglycan/xylan/chitin deacetylase (PgdA/CDA1 family)